MTKNDLNRKLLVANWKCNGSFAENKALITSLLEADEFKSDMVICAPFVYLQQVAALIADSPLKLGAQNLSANRGGAYTGEISAQMLIDLGVDYVLVGHSERRSLYGETYEQIAQKMTAALDAGLTPILCLGETLAERQAGATKEVILQQLQSAISQLKGEDIEKILIAYEPIWAIGTGETASPEQAEEIHQLLKDFLENLGVVGTKILYGGSLNDTNVASLFKMPNIDGGLVGGASLDAQKFLFISNFEN